MNQFADETECLNLFIYEIYIHWHILAIYKLISFSQVGMIGYCTRENL